MKNLAALCLVPVIAMSCKGGGGAGTDPKTGTGGDQAVAPAYPATRFVPPAPTYVLAARSVKDLQHGFKDLADAVGVLFGEGSESASRGLRNLLQIDPLSPDAMSAAGVDLNGGIAVFSDALNPTVVVHLAAADQANAWFDQQRSKGMTTQSVIVEGSEIFTTTLVPRVRISWAVVDEWLWVHLAFDGVKDDGTSWFRPKAAAAGTSTEFGRRWAWAAKANVSLSNREPGVIGYANLVELVRRATIKVPDAQACAKLLEPVQGVAVGMDSDGPKASGRIAIDLGNTAGAMQSHVLGAPAGWDAASSKAALAVQWNVDAMAIADWLGPCAIHLGIEDRFDQARGYGVRTARAFLETIDLNDKSGRGAVALDLTSSKYLDEMLDQVPLRSTLEKPRTFGSLKGASISVPFGPSVDYVLNDKVALAAMGDGVMVAAVGNGAPQPGAAASIDIVPAALPADTWKQLLELARWDNPEATVRLMNRWQRGHIGLAIDGTSLVLEARGVRK